MQNISSCINLSSGPTNQWVSRMGVRGFSWSGMVPFVWFRTQTAPNHLRKTGNGKSFHQKNGIS